MMVPVDIILVFIMILLFVVLLFNTKKYK